MCIICAIKNNDCISLCNDGLNMEFNRLSLALKDHSKYHQNSINFKK